MFYESHGRELAVNGVYQHFKNESMKYRVLYVARDSETEEDLVIYRQMYGDKSVWSRPLSMFLDTVKRDEYEGPRFILLEY